MHAFVPSVLLRMSRLDPFWPDAQLHPPYRQPRQPAHRARGERRPVVGADRLGHSMLAECGLEDGLHPRAVGLLHRLAAQQIPAVGVGDGQRIDARTIAGAKPALEVGAPDPVGRIRRAQWLGVRRHPPTLLACNHQPLPRDHLPDGAGRRPPLSRPLLRQRIFQLPRTPLHVRPTKLQHRLLDRLRRLVRMALRCPPQVPQPFHPGFPIAPQPHVSGLPRHPVHPTKVADRVLAAFYFHDEPHPFIHDTARFPGHVEVQHARLQPTRLSGMSPV